MASDTTQAYVAVPDTGSGPGVLVLHSWWGLTAGTRAICDRLAGNGFVAMAPDLFGGAIAEDPEEGQDLLAGVDPNILVRDVLAASDVLQKLPAVTGERIGVLGMSMGASMGLWLSDRAAKEVCATVAFYGVQDISFADTSSAYLCHFAETDPYIDENAAAFLEAVLHLGDNDSEIIVHHYPGTSHWFFEPGQDAYDAAAADLAWERTIDFLDRHLSAD